MSSDGQFPCWHDYWLDVHVIPVDGTMYLAGHVYLADLLEHVEYNLKADIHVSFFISRLLFLIRKGQLLQLKFGVSVNIHLWAR